MTWFLEMEVPFKNDQKINASEKTGSIGEASGELWTLTVFPELSIHSQYDSKRLKVNMTQERINSVSLTSPIRDPVLYSIKDMSRINFQGGTRKAQISPFRHGYSSWTKKEFSH